MRRRWLVALALALALVSGAMVVRLAGPQAAAAERMLAPTAAVELLPPAARRRAGGMDVTFLVTSDTHFGYRVPAPEPGAPPRPLENAQGIEKAQLVAIEAMRSMEGKAYPRELGGRVGKPRGLLISGDLTEDGEPHEWERFVRFFGLDGSDGLVPFPVFEGIGNHDKHYGWYVKERVAERHGANRYAWDWDDVHLVCLGEGPDDDDLAWLREDLARVGDEVGIVLYFHFPLEGPYSTGHWFGRGSYRASLARLLEGRNVLGIFHGHFHGSGPYRWNGHDVFNVGSAKHHAHSFAVVHLDDERMTVASYNYDDQGWWWWHERPIFGAAGERRLWRAPGRGIVGDRGWPED